MNPWVDRLRLMLVTDGVGDVDRIQGVVTAVLTGGFTAVQVREPKLGAGQLAALCERLWPVVCEHAAVLLVNDRVDVAALDCAHGVHLGFRSLVPSQARDVLGAEKLVGFSAHDGDELAWARDQGVDYVILAPVFATQSKPDAKPLGVKNTQALVSAAQVPVILLGGLNEQTLADALAIDAHGHAFMSAVFGAPDPHEAARGLASISRRRPA